MSIVTNFRKALNEQLASRGLQASLWRGAGRISAHLLEVSTTPRLTVLYVKVSTSVPGFWGLTKNQLDNIEKSRVRWFCVFLHRSANVGYLLSGGQVLMRVRDGSLTLGQDGDYKVNQRADFVSPQKFETLNALISRSF
jgi:hypothetical protein